MNKPVEFEVYVDGGMIYKSIHLGTAGSRVLWIQDRKTQDYGGLVWLSHYDNKYNHMHMLI